MTEPMTEPPALADVTVEAPLAFPVPEALPTMGWLSDWPDHRACRRRRARVLRTACLRQAHRRVAAVPLQGDARPARLDRGHRRVPALDDGRPAAGERVLGGHAIVAAGYDDAKVIVNEPTGLKTTGALLIRNSWGSGWGNAGYGLLPYEYVRRQLAVDWWVLTKAEWLDPQAFQA